MHVKADEDSLGSTRYCRLPYMYRRLPAAPQVHNGGFRFEGESHQLLQLTPHALSLNVDITFFRQHKSTYSQTGTRIGDAFYRHRFDGHNTAITIDTKTLTTNSIQATQMMVGNQSELNRLIFPSS